MVDTISPASPAEGWGFPSRETQHTMPPKKEQNINQSNGEELVPLSQVRDLMSQQKDLFMHLLQQQ